MTGGDSSQRAEIAFISIARKLNRQLTMGNGVGWGLSVRKLPQGEYAFPIRTSTAILKNLSHDPPLLFAA